MRHLLVSLMTRTLRRWGLRVLGDAEYRAAVGRISRAGAQLPSLRNRKPAPRLVAAAKIERELAGALTLLAAAEKASWRRDGDKVTRARAEVLVGEVS